MRDATKNRLRDVAEPFAARLNADVEVRQSALHRDDVEIRLKLGAFDHVSVVVWREGTSMDNLRSQLAGCVEAVIERVMQGGVPARDDYEDEE